MSVFVVLVVLLLIAALTILAIRAARGTRPPVGTSVYSQTLAAMPDDIAETVINYLGGRLDSPPCNFARITETNADGTLRYRLTIRTNPDGRHQRSQLTT